MKDRFKMAVAAHLFLIEKNKIVLLRRANTGYEDGKYSVIAGHLDGGEEVSFSMAREAREEAGIDILPEDINITGVMHRRTDHDERIDFFVTAGKWSGQIRNMEPGKCDDLSWFDLDHLPDNMIPYVKKAIQNHIEGKTFDSFGWSEKK